MAWVAIPDLALGMNLDAAPEEVPPGTATGGSNVRFRSGFAERARGTATAYNTPAIVPYHITHYQVGATRYVVYAGLQKTYADNGSTATNITLANNTGGIDDRWCGFVFNGVYVQNNGVDVPQYWNGTGTLTNLPAWPAGYKAGFLRPFKSYLVAGDITRGGVRERGTLLWSTEADPGTVPISWDITDPDEDAGDQPLAETNGTLIDALPLGDTLVLYKDDALHFAQAIDSNAVFRFGRFPGNTGLLARGCVVNTPQGHVFLTPGFDVVLFNGQGEPQSILEGTMRSWLASNINTNYAQRSFLVANPATNEVLVCFPSGASQVCDKALIWNWRDSKFWVRELSNVTYGSTGQVTLSSTDGWNSDSGSWDSDTTNWSTVDYAPNAPRLIFTRSTPALAMFDATSQDFGASFTASVDYTGMHFDAPESVKLVRAVRPRIEAALGTVVNVQVGGAMTPDGAITWADPVPFTVGTDIEAHCFATGRYLALRYATTGDAAWRTRGAQLDIVSQGNY